MMIWYEGQPPRLHSIIIIIIIIVIRPRALFDGPLVLRKCSSYSFMLQSWLRRRCRLYCFSSINDLVQVIAFNIMSSMDKQIIIPTSIVPCPCIFVVETNLLSKAYYLIALRYPLSEF